MTDEELENEIRSGPTATMWPTTKFLLRQLDATRAEIADANAKALSILQTHHTHMTEFESIAKERGIIQAELHIAKSDLAEAKAALQKMANANEDGLPIWYEEIARKTLAKLEGK